jgi:hypothetical protein
MKKSFETAVVCGDVREFNRALPRHLSRERHTGRKRNLATLRRRAALRAAAWGFGFALAAISTGVVIDARGLQQQIARVQPSQVESKP